MDSFLDYKKIFEIDIPSILEEVLNYQDVKDQIIYLNQDKQLSEGLDAKGQSIYTISSEEQGGNYPYSKYTVQLRSDKGLQVDAVDLKDTGAFWNTFDVKVTKETTEALADFNKGGDDIRNNFDKKFDFLGLYDENLEIFGQWLLQNYLSERLKEQLQVS
jgi:hypothetical protein